MDKQVRSSPFYFSFETSAAGVSRAEPAFQTPSLAERFDFHPQVTLRSKPFWGFHFTPAAGLRATHYGATLMKGQDSLNRVLGDFSADLRPPSFDKVFKRPFHGYRLKHVVEPDIRYHLVRAADAHDIKETVRFDETDILAETNEIAYSLTNSLLIRKDTPDGAREKPQARELLSLRLTQKYYFDPTFGGALQTGRNVVWEPTISLTGFAFAQGRRLSPVVSVLKLSPFSNYDTEVRADFDPSGGRLLNAGITSHVHRGSIGFSATDFFVNHTAQFLTPVALSTPLAQLPSFNLLRLVATYGEVSRKGFSTALGLDYNIGQGVTNQVVGQASYNFGCFALDFEFRRLALGIIRRENQFRIALSLANIGTFGNLKPGERLY
jgi:LPS-assembly protein